MIAAFITDETTGPRANELRGIVVAYEGARMLGWM